MLPFQFSTSSGLFWSLLDSGTCGSLWSQTHLFQSPPWEKQGWTFFSSPSSCLSWGSQPQTREWHSRLRSGRSRFLPLASVSLLRTFHSYMSWRWSVVPSKPREVRDGEGNVVGGISAHLWGLWVHTASNQVKLFLLLFLFPFFLCLCFFFFFFG